MTIANFKMVYIFKKQKRFLHYTITQIHLYIIAYEIVCNIMRAFM